MFAMLVNIRTRIYDEVLKGLINIELTSLWVTSDWRHPQLPYTVCCFVQSVFACRKRESIFNHGLRPL
jgi:hypothetical protein